MDFSERKPVTKFEFTSSILEKLSPTERKYFNMVWPQSGVVMLFSRPGEAKSALCKGMALKLGMQYLEIRLSQVDETDIGLFPKVNQGSDEEQDYVKFVPPEWAIMANERPTFIHFEELNRAPLTVRNAALQILNERLIGYRFSFNENVYMIASGNLGEKDGTNVEEMDAALNNRLIHVHHELKLDEWIENFAKGKIHQSIINFLSVHGEFFYKENHDKPAYATPRSWTFLSDYIVRNFGLKSKISSFMVDISKIGHYYIGETSQPYFKYLQDVNAINITHIMDDYDKYAKQIKEIGRGKESELLQEIKIMNIFTDISEKQAKNIFKFFHSLDKDQYTAYVLDLMKKDVDTL
jgi:hypothetical protein